MQRTLDPFRLLLAVPATGPSDELEGVLEPPQGTCGRGGLVHRGSMDSSRTAALRGAVLHRLVQPTRENRWDWSSANGLWMSPIGRNHSDPVDGLLIGKRYLIRDRDPLFTAEFLERLADIGIQSVKCRHFPPT